MKANKQKIFGFAVATTAMIILVAAITSRKPVPAIVTARVTSPVALNTPELSKSTAPMPLPDGEISTTKEMVLAGGNKNGAVRSTKPANAASQTAKPAKVKEPAQDPTARRALSFVGADADAEAYWIAAINDPTLSANERKDLIEDLNEDGLSDPKHPGAQDLPLILNRLLLIEELVPYAMDQVNYDAFKEAYKDLADMLDGKPVL